jgi:hypothetical protein
LQPPPCYTPTMEDVAVPPTKPPRTPTDPLPINTPFTDHESQLSPVDRSRTRWRRPPGRTREHYRDNTSEEALATDHPRSSTSEEAFAPRRDGDPTRARAAPPRLCLTDQWPQQQDDAAPNRLNEGRRHPAMRGHRNSQNAAQAERRRPTHNLYPQISPRGARIWAKGGRIHGSEGAAVREGGRSLRRKKGGGGGERATTRPVVRPAAGCHCHPTTTEAATARETLANGGTSRARGVAPESPLGDHARANLAFQVLQFHSSGMRLLILISCALTFSPLLN